MHIQELSNKIDQKLREIDERHLSIKTQIDASQDGDEQQKLTQDLVSLDMMKAKLEKSRDLAWRAHRLQQEDKNLIKMRRLNRLGLAMVILSVIAGTALVGYLIFLEFGV